MKYEIDTYNVVDVASDGWYDSFNYPTIYIIENGKNAYVGESVDYTSRVTVHQRTFMSYEMMRVHVIKLSKANKSATLHYESMLIRLMQADQKFNILNDAAGMQNNQYSNRQSFEQLFDSVWEAMIKRGLAKEHNFNLIYNSEFFKFSPYTNLNDEQQTAIWAVERVMEENIHRAGQDNKALPRPMLISGEPGTGKTVVASYLMKYMHDSKRAYDKEFKIGLVISQKALLHSVKKVFAKVQGLLAREVMTPSDVVNDYLTTKKKFDLLVCDEAHNLKTCIAHGQGQKIFKDKCRMLSSLFDQSNEDIDELDWILACSKNQVFFYDQNQYINPSNIQPSSFMTRLRERDLRRIALTSQMRVEGGEDYVDFVNSLFVPRIQFCHYDLRLYESFADMRQDIIAHNKMDRKGKNVGLSRVCAGYAWEWKTKKKKGVKPKGVVDIELDGVRIKWNAKVENWPQSPNSVKEMGSIYSLQGFDLNYCGVVIGPDIAFDRDEGKILLRRENFYDIGVKKKASDEQVLECVINTYKTLLTRGIKGTYVYICDPALREHFKQYMQWVPRREKLTGDSK